MMMEKITEEAEGGVRGGEETLSLASTHVLVSANRKER